MARKCTRTVSATSTLFGLNRWCIDCWGQPLRILLSGRECSKVSATAGGGKMPKPPRAMCGDDTLFVCEKCAKCVDHCACEVPGALVSVNGRAGHEAIRSAIRAGQEAKKAKKQA